MNDIFDNNCDLISSKTKRIKITYYSFFIISIMCYIESILALFAAFGVASEYGSTGLGAIAVWSYHFLAIIILVIFGSVSFLIELCYQKIVQCSTNIFLNKNVYAIFLVGFIIPVLLIFIIPIISVGFDIKLGNKSLENQNINVSQKELDEINNRYEELNRKMEPDKSIPKAQEDFYNEQMTKNEIEKVNHSSGKISFISQTELDQIALKWQPPQTENYIYATIKVEISANQILSKNIVKSSGNVEFDNSVKATVDSVIPMLQNSGNRIYGLTFLAGPNLKEISNDSRI